ncbi:ribonuclease MRP protein subunit POP4 isoform X3 [Silene latifolia]|uniref:ribonuclease MRP protein subunit POP4 isoform X3 n=1 Tax=Silene latifolia TaxID=37657 RepID=UPI003D76C04E
MEKCDTAPLRLPAFVSLPPPFTYPRNLIKLPLLAMSANTMLEDSKKRALEAVERRFASEARVQHRQTRDKRIRHDQNPGMNADPENVDPTFARISEPVHENLLTAQASNKDKSTVDKLLHELLRKGDAAQKYIQGSKNMKFDHQINLDNYYKKNNSSGTRLRALQANSKRSKKHMSMKQLKRAGLLDLPEEFHKFELFISMHEMWKEYVIHLLKNIGKNQVAAILFGANLHGAIFRVVECKIDSFVGVLGIMIRETAETFGIITQDNKFRAQSISGLRLCCQ